MKTDRSRQLFAEARELIPGGVDSPVRAFRAVGGEPLFIDHASGCRVFDVDGNSFVDYVASWGPLIFGHANRTVVSAIQAAAERGTSYGAPSPLESDRARMVVDAVPSGGSGAGGRGSDVEVSGGGQPGPRRALGTAVDSAALLLPFRVQLPQGGAVFGALGVERGHGGDQPPSVGAQRQPADPRDGEVMVQMVEGCLGFVTQGL